ncbi:MAG: hypothetical protein ACOC41_08620, partial [Chitinivibrionales bacterium]
MAGTQVFRTAIGLIFLMLFLKPPVVNGQDATVDWNDEQQVIDGGVGIAFANAINLFYNHPEPVRTYILDQTFSVSNGFGFANCRTQPGSG